MKTERTQLGAFEGLGAGNVIVTYLSGIFFGLTAESSARSVPFLVNF